MVSFIPIYPALTDSKTPTSRFEKNKKDRWAITVRKSPIEVNMMLVTQAFSQDVKFLACVPLSTISGG